MTATIQLTEIEAEARSLLEASVDYDKDLSGHFAVRQVFRAAWANSLEVDRVLVIANALTNLTYNRDQIQHALTTLVRRKALRTRRICGINHYELNFS